LIVARQMLADFFESESDQPPKRRSEASHPPARKQLSSRPPPGESSRSRYPAPPFDHSTHSSRSESSRGPHRSPNTLADLPPTLTEGEVLEFLGNFGYRLTKEIQLYRRDADERMSAIEESILRFTSSCKRPR
jgi:hypothetical protein